MPTQNVSQSNCRKAGLITLFGPGPTVILLIGPLIEIASLLLSRAGEMLQATAHIIKSYVITLLI